MNRASAGRLAHALLDPPAQTHLIHPAPTDAWGGTTVMSLDSTLRIGDADGDRVVAVLGQRLGLGHLTMHELENRLDTAYAARTRGELDAVFADLPATGPPRPRPSPPGEVSALSFGPDADAWLVPVSSRGAGVAITAGA